MEQTLKNRCVVLGVTGGIAAYKACTIARLLIGRGAAVQVIMTEAAARLVGPATFEALTGRPVCRGVFDNPGEISHINLAKRADVLAIAPATANTLAKISCGLADNLLTATALAATCPVVLAPAMNANMYRNAATQQNLQILRSRGLHLVGPASGALACGDSGEGRMSEPEEIVDFIDALLNRRNLARLGFDENTMLPAPESPLEIAQTHLLPKADGVGRRVLITAGPTVEAIDPVRYLSNRSSGKMGFALAEAARRHGAEVTLIAGPVDLPTPQGVRRIDVRSAQEMLQAVEERVRESDLFIGCAAVADYRVARESDTKLTKEELGDEISVRLVKNPDIVATVGSLSQGRPYTVGFAAETGNGEERARRKLEQKRLDLIVLNDVSDPKIGFGSDDNAVTVYDHQGRVAAFGVTPKRVLADLLMGLFFEGAAKRQGK
ncbi:MAG: bifunctional phosphopantothenoylcysteine decarboxylase/phosphopantothenate--cysteine ligase CoaBC [Succinivibrionaceae bacterium]|nr:bifunctional phosphopantothenoylcysteine decarboxylase/phosphopantothenate--cysteine ligase CoaBC [Succinivibrionaceae bacterium]